MGCELVIASRTFYIPFLFDMVGVTVLNISFKKKKKEKKKLFWTRFVLVNSWQMLELYMVGYN